MMYSAFGGQQTAPTSLSQCANMRVAVVGGSLGGLGAANVFHRLGASVTVFEKRPQSFENLGSGMGFVDVDLWQQIRGAQFIRRGQQAHRGQGAFYYGDLWSFLYAGLPAGSVKFGQTVEDLGDNVDAPTINGELFDIVIVADGGWSQLRSKYVDPLVPEYAGYQGIRGTIDASQLPGFATRGYHESNGIYDSMILPVPTCDGRNLYMGGIFVATPESEIRRPEAGAHRHAGSATKTKTAPEWLLPLVEKLFGDRVNGDIVRFFKAAVAQGTILPSPQFEHGVTRAVNGRVVVIGDAAHMASPRTAAGAHTAMLDAQGLFDAFQGDVGIDTALQMYNKGGVERAQALYSRSRQVSRAFLPRQGKQAVVSPASLVSY